MDLVTAGDGLTGSAGPVFPNLAAWVIIFVTAYVGGSIAELIPKAREVKWLRPVASVLGWFVGAAVGAFVASMVVDYAFDSGSETTAAPGWVGLIVAFAVTSFAAGFITAGIAQLIPQVDSASRWLRRIAALLAAAVTAAIVWFVAYYAFDVALPGPLTS